MGATGLLSACAMFEGEQPQSPAVRAARACMKQVKGPMEQAPDYYIGACTNTGVWIVEKRAPETGATLAQYDFVNHLYSGAETGGGYVSIDSLGGILEQEFKITQKNLNAALLEK